LKVSITTIPKLEASKSPYIHFLLKFKGTMKNDFASVLSTKAKARSFHECKGLVIWERGTTLGELIPPKKIF
jgi:hypothetical protein